ncbi:hypothetical protein [Streptomyces hygroscopicus]|uniref:hypothetical protein n=1 Tax=Streptomyces hygroscopicus TaxID=1912 RepID=UPI003A1016D2
MARVLGELPAVLPADRAEQAAHVIPHPLPRLYPPESLAHPQQQGLQLTGPQTRFDIRLHDWLNALRSGESRTTAPLMGRQSNRLETDALTSANGETRLEY